MEQYGVKEFNDIEGVNSANNIEEWERLLQEADNSDMTRLQWCEANGISPRRFYYWQRKIRETQNDDTEYPSHSPGKVGTFCELDLSSIKVKEKNCMADGGAKDMLLLECGPFRLQIPQAFLMEVLKNA